MTETMDYGGSAEGITGKLWECCEDGEPKWIGVGGEGGRRIERVYNGTTFMHGGKQVSLEPSDGSIPNAYKD